MKKIIFLITFPIIAIGSSGQNYIPLVDTGSVWNITWNCYPPPPVPCYSFYYKYRMSGDTVYNDTSYKKLYRIDMNTYCSSIIEDSIYVGGIREDLSGKKVFFIEDASWNWGENLLYDFSLEVGDTVPPTYNNFGYPELYVSSIDSVLCTDGYRERFIYSRDTYTDIEVIEGIGANTGLLEAMENFEHIPTLRCFYHYGSKVYMHSSVNSCKLEMDTCFYTQILRTNMKPEHVTIFPNPVNNGKPLELRSSQIIKRFDIYNSQGVLVKMEKPYSSINPIIETKQFKPGIYLILILFETNQMLVKKLVVI